MYFFFVDLVVELTRLTIACLNLMDLAEVRARGQNSSVYGTHMRLILVSPSIAFDCC
jgi:hypothetical protein